MEFNRIIIFLAILVLVSGCTGITSKCPECPGSSSYSECDDQAIKTRTNYRCDETTNFECESFKEEKQCSTEITLTGNIEATIKPSIEQKVKGIIKFEIKNVPEDTVLVAYYLAGGDLAPIGLERMPLFASNQGDVWTGMIDTNDYENGLFEVMVIANNEESLEGNPQYYARGQILVSNK